MSRKRGVVLYSVLYCLLAAGIWGWFYLAGRSFICDADAYEQHINAMMLYGRWLRACPGYLIAGLKAGRGFMLPNYSFGLGYGGDIYTSLQYYAVGDPLNLPLAFIPTRAVYYYYHFLILLRPYLAGLSFIALSGYLYRGKDKENSGMTRGIISGALVYAFSGTVLFIGMWNPFFTAPMILLPLMILGARRIMDLKRPGLFIAAVFAAGITNFYFFYMLVLMTAGYCIISVFSGEDKKGFREAAGTILRIFACGVLGTMMAMFILLPVALAFVSNPRAGVLEHGVRILYEADYYRELLRNLTAYIYHPRYDTELCLTFIALPAMAYLFTERRKNRRLFILVVIMAVMLLIPAAGYVMGGFSYMINRWCFAFALPVSYTAAMFIDRCGGFDRKQRLIVTAASACYCLAVFVFCRHGIERAALCQIVILVIFCVICMVPFISERLGSGCGIMASALVLAAILCNGYFANAEKEGNLPSGFVEASGGSAFYEQYMSNEVLALKEVTGKDAGGFMRYTGRNLIWNSPLMTGISSTQFYWSLANGAIADYMSEMALNEMADYSYFGLDDRLALLALSGTDYYTLRYQTDEEAAYVPAGFTKAGDYYNFGVFENALKTGAGYVYTDRISQEQYMQMEPYMRDEALMQAVYTENDAAGESTLPGPEFTYTMSPVTLTPGEGVVLEGDSFVVSEEGAECAIRFDGAEQSETMLYIEGLEYDGDVSAMNIAVRGENGTVKYIAYKTPGSQFYSGWHDYLVNLCYSEQACGRMTLQFPVKGTYRFDSLSVVCKPVVPYFEHLVRLTQGGSLDMRIGESGISHTTAVVNGSVASAEGGFMLLVIPWQKGWSILIDGQKSPLYKANTMFMGTEITPGEHTFELYYRTPGLIEGAIISLAACIAVPGFLFLQKRRTGR
ncbi:MAG: YfhO family protein [Lachnospiraceae bacterium]|nr:YfhO family protein [Lachnospiraceae bacterium]